MKAAFLTVIGIVGVAIVLGILMSKAVDNENLRVQQFRDTHPDAIECRRRGGFPVWSPWSGAFLDCKAFPRGEVAPNDR